MDRSEPRSVIASVREADAIELHSDDMRALLGTPPHWVVRSGQGYLLALLLSALFLTWFVHYPDTIDAPVTLTATAPPASVVARNAGYLVLRVNDNERITEGQYLGYVTNAADVNAVMQLQRTLAAFGAVSNNDSALSVPLPTIAHLGDLQAPYQSFAKSVNDYRLSRNRRALELQRRALEREIADYERLIEQTRSTNAILAQELDVARTRHRMDSVLFVAGKLSSAEYLAQKRASLGAEREYESSGASITNTRITIAQLDARIRELTAQEEQQNRDYLDAIEAGASRVAESIKAWELSYALVAPMSGRVALYNYWTDHQYVRAGDEILTVIASEERYFGKATAPIEGSGKIQVGQRADIKFVNYPAEEFGTVRGVVQSMSLLPRERAYSVTIALPNGLVTRYGKRLDFKQEMLGTATIVTEDLRLLERVMYRLRKTVDRS